MTDPSVPSRATTRTRAALPLLAALGVLVAFFAPALATDGTFLYRDNGRMHVPHKRLVAERLSRGELPQWNPYGGLGHPLVAGAVDAVQHPFNALLVLLPFGLGFKLWGLLSFAVAACGAYAWARALGLGDAGAAAAALGLALTGYLVSSTDNYQYLTALASVPLLVAVAHRFVAAGGPGRALLLAIASGFTAAAGDPQSWGIAVLLLPAYALAFVTDPGATARMRLFRGVLAIAVSVVGAAPFVVPMLAWMPHSSRGDTLFWVELERYNLLPVRLAEFGLPALLHTSPVRLWSSLYEAFSGNRFTPLPWVRSEYLGATVLALSVLGASRSRRAAIALAGAAAFAWMAMGTGAGFGQLARHLPLLGGFRYWEKVAFFVALLAVVAAAFGVDALLREPSRGRRFAYLTGATGVALLGAHAAARLTPATLARLVLRPGFPEESARFAQNLTGALLHSGAALVALALVVAAASAARLSHRGAAIALVAVVALDLAIANADAYLLSPPALVRPSSVLAAKLRQGPDPSRVVTPFAIDDTASPPYQPFEWAELRGALSLQSGWNVDQRVGNFEPYTGMIAARAMRFRLRTGTMKQIPQVGMWGFGHVALPPDAMPIAPRYGLLPPLDVVAVEPATRTLLVRIPHRPRAYLADEVSSVDRRGAMEFVLDPASVTTRRSVVEAPVPSAVGGGSARIEVDDPERVVVAVDARAPSLLVLNDTYAPGWTATVDGMAAEILPANYLARGVWVAAGRHGVEFRYRTPGLALGWAIATCGLAVLGTAALLRARRRRGR